MQTDRHDRRNENERIIRREQPLQECKREAMRVSGDTAQARAALKKLRDDADKTGTDVAKSLGEEAKAAVDKLEDASKGLKKQSKEVEAAAQKGVSGDTAQARAELEKLRAQAGKTGGDVVKSLDAEAEAAVEAAKAIKALNRASKALKDQSEQVKATSQLWIDAEKRLEKAKYETAKAEKVLEEATRDLEAQRSGATEEARNLAEANLEQARATEIAAQADVYKTKIYADLARAREGAAEAHKKETLAAKEAAESAKRKQRAETEAADAQEQAENAARETAKAVNVLKEAERDLKIERSGEAEQARDLARANLEEAQATEIAARAEAGAAQIREGAARSIQGAADLPEKLVQAVLAVPLQECKREAILPRSSGGLSKSEEQSKPQYRPPKQDYAAIAKASRASAAKLSQIADSKERARAVTRKATERTGWVSSGEGAVPGNSPLVVAGRAIGGMVYVGTPPRLNHGYWDKCRAYIDPSLSVARDGTDKVGNHMPYWPGYSDITSQCRATYLDWLAGGRSDPSYDRGYMFLYFYGLERRFVLDRPAEAEKREILQEVRRLKDLYPDNGSVQRYLGEFIQFARISLNDEAIHEPLFDYRGWELPLSLKVAIGARVGRGDLLSADWVLSWLMCHPERRLHTPATRCVEEFRALFRPRFDRRFPSGLKLTKPRKVLKYTYQAASSEFQEMPDISGRRGRRHIWITDPATGEAVKRQDWIQKAYQDETGPYYGNRGAIAKMLTEIQGEYVPRPYRIVFAATKHMDHVEIVRARAAEAKAETKAAAPDEAPSGPPKLNAARIAAIQSDTARVSSMLGDIFDDTPEVPEEAKADETVLGGLDAKHSHLAKALIAQDRWTEEAFEELCREAGLLASGAIEDINEWSYDTYDEALLDEHDGYVLPVDHPWWDNGEALLDEYDGYIEVSPYLAAHLKEKFELAKRAMEMDPEVAGILKEEATLEADFRARESSGLESQPDLGLDTALADGALQRAREARARLAETKSDTHPTETDLPTLGFRRGLLPDIPDIEDNFVFARRIASRGLLPDIPDIEEIDASLRTGGEGEAQNGTVTPGDDSSAKPRSGGFARGFALSLLILAAAILIYGNAPTISDRVPRVGNALNSYVNGVDKARLWLDTQIDSLLQ